MVPLKKSICSKKPGTPPTTTNAPGLCPGVTRATVNEAKGTLVKASGVDKEDLLAMSSTATVQKSPGQQGES